jgi:hypothetical protein
MSEVGGGRRASYSNPQAPAPHPRDRIERISTASTIYGRFRAGRDTLEEAKALLERLA